MGENTKIPWCDHTWNPWIGCTPASTGCLHCYAEDQDRRYSWTPEGWGHDRPRHRTSESNWKKPYTWHRKAHKTGVTPSVFVGSLMDFFDDEVDQEWRMDALNVMAETPNNRYLILTKRPQNIVPMFLDIFKPDGNSDEMKMARILSYFKNIWFGVSIENQKTAKERIPILCEQIPVPRRFISAEPLLELVLISGYLQSIPKRMWPQWLIAGGESGPVARLATEEMFGSLAVQCQAFGIKFFMKQMGSAWAKNFNEEGLNPGKKGENMLCWPDPNLRKQEFPW